MRTETPKITGLLFNCAMNCALPRLLDNIEALVALEKKQQLPDEARDAIYANYVQLKTIFMTYYGIGADVTCSWEMFFTFLSLHSFYAQEIMFVPVFRIFIADMARSDEAYKKEDIWRIRDLQSRSELDAEIYAVTGEENPAIGRYNNLEISTVAVLFYHTLAIGNVRLYEYNEDAGTYFTRETGVQTGCITPAWIQRTSDNFNMFLREAHYELLPGGEELAAATAVFTKEVNALEEPLAAVHDTLSSSQSAEQSSLGLSYLVHYVHGALQSSMDITREGISFDTYLRLTHTYHSASDIGQETFAVILLAIAAREPEVKIQANLLLDQGALSPALVRLIVDPTRDLCQTFETIRDETQVLIRAVVENSADEALRAIEKGANVNGRIIQKDGMYVAATSDDLFVKKGPVTVTVDPSREEVEFVVYGAGTTTLLNLVAKSAGDNVAMAEILIYAGADMGAIDCESYWTERGDVASSYFQNTPLLGAIAACNIKVATEYMARLNQHVTPYEGVQILNYKDKFSEGFHTALEFAIRRGFSQLAIAIVRAGANPNPARAFYYAYGGGSPLHMACMLLGYAQVRREQPYYPLELITTLLEHGADYTRAVRTGVYPAVLNQLSHTAYDVYPFDYLDLVIRGARPRAWPINRGYACTAPAFSPTAGGQVVHPFHEERSFIGARDVAQGRLVSRRAQYLASEVFTDVHRGVIQEALYRRMLHDMKVEHAELARDALGCLIFEQLELDKDPGLFGRLEQSGLFPRNMRPSPRVEELSAGVSSTLNIDTCAVLSTGRIRGQALQMHGVFKEERESSFDGVRRRHSFNTACTSMILVLNRLHEENKISLAQHDTLYAELKQLYRQPKNHQQFMRNMRQYEALAGGKVFAWCKLVAGYALKFCTCGAQGQTWVDDAKRKLEQIDCVETVASEAEKIYCNRY